jgi:hypothetical protein
MYQLERYQMLQKLTALDDAGTVVDLTDATTTHFRYYAVPESTPFVLKKFGLIYSAAGGAQTTAGTAALYINGTKYDPYTASPTLYPNVTAADFYITSEVSHDAYDNYEVDLDPVAQQTLVAGTSNSLTAIPAYPVINPGDVVEVKVVTQGVGAGNQEGYVYILGSQYYS